MGKFLAPITFSNASDISFEIPDSRFQIPDFCGFPIWNLESGISTQCGI
jgi:hypothetical protein